VKFKNQHLGVLLKAAAPPPEPCALPPHLRHRILAEWRLAQAVGERLDWRRVFHIGLACACVFLLLTAVFSLRDGSREPSSEFEMPALVINLALR
jgi:hypothetical protein